jgi:hypothetical protein
MTTHTLGHQTGLAFAEFVDLQVGQHMPKKIEMQLMPESDHGVVNGEIKEYENENLRKDLRAGRRDDHPA